MPNLDQEIVTGAREPRHTGVTSMPMADTKAPIVRRRQLQEGQVEFHAKYRRYRVEFQKPKQQLNRDTGEVLEEGARFLAFENFTCVTENPTLIHQAKGCKSIPGATVNAHKHDPQKCRKGCTDERWECIMGHQDPRNPTRLYYPQHPSLGLALDFWDAADMDVKLKKEAKANFLKQAQQIVSEMPAEDIPEFLAATGIEGFNIPPKEVTK